MHFPLLKKVICNQAAVLNIYSCFGDNFAYFCVNICFDSCSVVVLKWNWFAIKMQ